MNTQRGRWEALPEQMLRIIRAKRRQKRRVHFNSGGKKSVQQYKREYSIHKYRLKGKTNKKKEQPIRTYPAV